MKLKKIIKIAGILCLCLVYLNKAERAFTQVEDFSQPQNNEFSSTEESAQLPTLPSSVLSEDMESTSSRQSLDSLIENNSDTPTNSTSDIETSGSITQKKNDGYIVRDWKILRGEIVEYLGKDTDIVIPSVIDPDSRNLCTVNLKNIKFTGPVTKGEVTSIQFGPKVKINGSASCKEYSSLRVFDASNAIIDTEDISKMFYGLSNLTIVKGLKITSKVTNTSFMFSDASSLTRVDLSNSDTRNVTNMSYMFFKCGSLFDIDLSSFDTRNVRNMEQMFFGCKRLKELDLSSFDTQNVTDMSGMFAQNYNLTNIDLANFNTQNVTSMRYMFASCRSLLNLNVSNFNTQNVTDMNNMFESCSTLTNLDLNSFNTQNVQNMAYMFYSCNGLKKLDLSSFDTRNVTDMNRMFAYSDELKSLNVESFNTQKVSDMSGMFYKCKNLTCLDLRSFYWKTDVRVKDMFYENNLSQKKIFAQATSPLDNYDFEEKNIVPFIAVELEAGEGVFSDGTHKKNIKYKDVINPSIDFIESIENPELQGFGFMGWNKDTTVEPQKWTAQWSFILPNMDGISSDNTMINGLEKTRFGLAYWPKYLKGSGNLLKTDNNRTPLSPTEPKKGILYLYPTDSHGGSKANRVHVGIKDTTNKMNSWRLHVSYSNYSKVPGIRLFFEDPEVNKNNGGNIEPTQDVVIYGKKSTIDKDEVSDGHEYITVPSSTLFGIMIANGGNNQTQNGIYDFSAKVGLLFDDNSKVSAGDYLGKVEWSLLNVPS